MERDIQARLCVAAERMGTGMLRTGAALERIAAAMEKQAEPRGPFVLEPTTFEKTMTANGKST